MIDAALTNLGAERIFEGISPHAPYSVEPDGFRECVDMADTICSPITTHLAESLDEERLLNDHSGPLRELWEAMGAWDDHVPRFAGSPVAFADSVGCWLRWRWVRCSRM